MAERSREWPDLPTFPTVGPTGSRINSFRGLVEDPLPALLGPLSWYSRFTCDDGTEGYMVVKRGSVEWEWGHWLPKVLAAPGEGLC